MKQQRKSNSWRRGGQPGNSNAGSHGFYADKFTTDEIALVAAFAAEPDLADEIWMQRVLNLRLFSSAGEPGADGAPIPIDTLIGVAEALAIGTGRVARLLRDRRVLSGESAAALAEAMAIALDEIATALGVPL